MVNSYKRAHSTISTSLACNILSA